MIQAAFLLSGTEVDHSINSVRTTECYFLLVVRAGEGIVRSITFSLNYDKFSMK